MKRNLRLNNFKRQPRLLNMHSNLGSTLQTKPRSMWKSLWFFLFFSLTNLCTAAPTLQIEPSHVQLNETFRLILTTDHLQSRQLPDFMPLQHDFTILGTEQNRSYTIINGQTTSLSQWIILLRAKKAGKLSIPAIKIGPEQTEPGYIDVSINDTSTTSFNDTNSLTDNVMLKATLSEEHPYINQQVLYTVRLFNNKRLLNAEYHPPTVEEALMIPLGNGRHYETQYKGQTYGVEEQQYAIFPQKSGLLKINSPSFTAAIYDDIPKQLNLKTKVSTLSVRQVPADFPSKNWLPAKKVILLESYDFLHKSLKEGDTLTRTITLQAVAMPAQLIPSLKFKATDEVGIYPESPEEKNEIRFNELVGTSTIKLTYLLNKSGKITLPAIQVPWFNTTTGKTEIAKLKSHTLTVKPGKQATTTSPPSKTTFSPKTDTSASLTTNKIQEIPHNTWWGLVIGFIAAWVFILVFWLARRARLFNPNNAEKKAIKQVQIACKKNNPSLARNALIHWAKLHWPEANILNFQDIAKFTHSTTLKNHLQSLSEALYNPNHQTHWQGAGLLRNFEAYLLQIKQSSKPYKKEQRSDLPPINPN